MRCSGGLWDLGVAFPARSYHAEQVPGHSAFPFPVAFCIVRFLRMQYGVRNKRRQGDKWVVARGMLVKVGVNRSHFSHPPSSYCAVTRHRYDARANERVSCLLPRP